MTAQRALVLLLRLMACMLLLAFPAIVLPESWMAATHAWLGMGEFPAAPLTEYLTRSIAVLYGFHGVLLLIVAGDVVRYRAIVTYIGVMSIIFGAIMLAVDLHAGMPWWWTAGEGPPLAGMGLVVLLLNRAAGRSGSGPKKRNLRPLEPSKMPLALYFS